MPPLPRRSLLPRPAYVRDASLFVIATEGSDTEPAYFEGIRALLNNEAVSRVRVEILPTDKEAGDSSATHLRERLERFRERYEISGSDAFWLVADVDRQGRKLSETLADLPGFVQLAISHPCFELWLYLHFRDADLHGEAWETLVQSCKGNVSGAMEKHLRASLVAETGAGYSKSNLPFEKYAQSVGAAIHRARSLDTNPAARWPTFPGTRVYQLLNALNRFAPAELRALWNNE